MTNIYFSDYFGLSPSDVEDYGAFDVSLINDLPLFIDPFLLFNSKDATHRRLHDEIIRYMRFLKQVSLTRSVTSDLIDAWFRFPEIKQNWFGFSKTGNSGHGLGVDFAKALCRNLSTVFRDFGEETVTKSSHLEKLCLIRGGVGRDNISDFTTNLIKAYLAEYTQVFARKMLSAKQRRRVALQKVRFNYSTMSWAAELFELPYINGDFVLLTPKCLLTKDEAWINRTELVDRFPEIAQALPNSALRAQINEYLRAVLPRGPRAKRKEIREALGRAVERFPQALDYYIREKEETGARAISYATARVREVEKIFVRQVRSFVSEHLDPAGFYKLPADTHAAARQRVLFLKDVIENKGGHRVFYVDGKPIQREADLHILYRLTWFATSSDVSREVNDGRGPADFKVSRGAKDKTIVEFKLAKNSQLERNLKKQAEIYERASDTTHPSLKVIMYFNLKQLSKVRRILKRLDLLDNQNIFLIDSRQDNKPSASRA